MSESNRIEYKRELTDTLDLVEYLGSGLPRILKAYPPEVFSFSENFLRMVFPYEGTEQVLPEDATGLGEKLGETREKTREKLIRALQENPVLTTEELAVLLSISPKGVEWQLSRLKSEGVLRRVGPAKGGHWEVFVG